MMAWTEKERLENALFFANLHIQSAACPISKISGEIERDIILEKLKQNERNTRIRIETGKA